MPSFFVAMKRILQGKPVYTPDDVATQAGTEAGQPPENANEDGDGEPETLIRKGDDRTFPIVTVRHCECRLDGRDMELLCHIINSSDMPVVLHKIILFGDERRMEIDLRPGQERHVPVYRGPQAESPDEHELSLEYKTETGDYFKAIHDIRFKYHPDTRTYSVDEVHLHPPVRDIFG